MKRSFRITTLILSLVFILGLVSACGATEPETSEITTEVTTAVPSTEETKESTSATETTTAEITRQTTRETVKLYSSGEVESIVEEEIRLAVMENYVLPPEGYPEGYPMPHATGLYAETYNKTADAFCVFGEDDSEIFVVYGLGAYGTFRPVEICYCDTKTTLSLWNRISYCEGGEKAVDIFAIDQKNFIVLWDFFKNGYCITVFEDGISPSEKYTYAPMYDGDMGELSFLFPAEEFEGAGEGLTDDGYVFFQSVTAFYFEEIDEGSCRIVLEYEKDGESHRRTAIYDINGIRPE